MSARFHDGLSYAEESSPFGQVEWNRLLARLRRVNRASDLAACAREAQERSSLADGSVDDAAPEEEPLPPTRFGVCTECSMRRPCLCTGFD
jgi:hypothetical protein